MDLVDDIAVDLECTRLHSLQAASAGAPRARWHHEFECASEVGVRVRAQARVLLASWEGHTGERKGVTTFYLLSTAPRDGPPKEAYGPTIFVCAPALGGGARCVLSK